MENYKGKASKYGRNDNSSLQVLQLRRIPNKKRTHGIHEQRSCKKKPFRM